MPNRASAIAVRIRALEKTFPAARGSVAALTRINADFAEGQFCVILGPSGCGKSTLIRIIAGLERPSSGKVLVLDEPVSGPNPHCGMVFQAYTSFPWLTVERNIAFGLKYSRKYAKREHLSRAREYADKVGLGEFTRSYINRLSGGMKQRVALASALVTEPRILLMDEPFGALDSQTRILMQEHLLELWETNKMTVLFVTHDIEEAIFLADRIFICSARPARIIHEMNVDLERPRTTAMRNRAEFILLRHHIFHLLRDETYKRLIEERNG
ncbi:ABC transporter ATP-binding protein [bacterium]|nr:ABC transporter ATP-binding protein [bacterium]